MSRRAVLLASLAVVLAVPAAAQACLADIPLEIIAGKADLIVIAEVVNAGEPLQLQLKQPDMKQPRVGIYRTYGLKITRTIKEKGKAPAKAAGRQVEVLTPARKPQPPGAPMLFVSDQYFASLKVGASYVLILSKLPGKDQYYLPSYPKNYARAGDAEKVKAIEAAADVDKWAWGAAGDGLQVALVLRQTSVKINAVTRRQRRPDGKLAPAVRKKLAYVNAVIALRNTSAKAITVNLYPEDRFLSLSAVGPGGRVVRPDWYEPLARMDLAAFGPMYLKTIGPGEVLFVGPMGENKSGLGLNLELTKGKWLLHATYKSARKAKTEAGQAVWTGEIKTKPVAVEAK